VRQFGACIIERILNELREFKRHATKLIDGVTNLHYEKGIKKLNLMTLKKEGIGVI